MPTAAESITTAIADPASASSDGQSVTSRSAQDLLALLSYSATLSNIGYRRRGLRYTKLTKPGALETSPVPSADSAFNNL